jgi:hypothetical protein
MASTTRLPPRKLSRGCHDCQGLQRGLLPSSPRYIRVMAHRGRQVFLWELRSISSCFFSCRVFCTGQRPPSMSVSAVGLASLRPRSSACSSHHYGRAWERTCPRNGQRPTARTPPVCHAAGIRCKSDSLGKSQFQASGALFWSDSSHVVDGGSLAWRHVDTQRPRLQSDAFASFSAPASANASTVARRSDALCAPASCGSGLRT